MTDESKPTTQVVGTEGVGRRVRAQEFPTDWTLCDVDDNVQLIDARTRIAGKGTDRDDR